MLSINPPSERQHEKIGVLPPIYLFSNLVMAPINQDHAHEEKETVSSLTFGCTRWFIRCLLIASILPCSWSFCIFALRTYVVIVLKHKFVYSVYAGRLVGRWARADWRSLGSVRLMLRLFKFVMQRLVSSILPNPQSAQFTFLTFLCRRAVKRWKIPTDTRTSPLLCSYAMV